MKGTSLTASVSSASAGVTNYGGNGMMIDSNISYIFRQVYECYFGRRYSYIFRLSVEHRMLSICTCVPVLISLYGAVLSIFEAIYYYYDLLNN